MEQDTAGQERLLSEAVSYLDHRLYTQAAPVQGDVPPSVQSD